jgi:hypothetical protein
MGRDQRDNIEAERSYEVPGDAGIFAMWRCGRPAAVSRYLDVRGTFTRFTLALS